MTELFARLLPFGLVLLMFVVGLRLDPQRLVAAFLRPAGLAVGLAVQWLGLPMLALIIAAAFDLNETMRAGLVLVALAPGGVTSNYIAHVARADLALSTSMTLVTTLFAGITIPLGLALTGAIDLPAGANLLGISAKMSAVAVLPAAVGMATAAVAPVVGATMLRWLDPVAKGVFLAMVLATFYQNRAAIMDDASIVGGAVIGLNLGALAIAAIAGRMTQLGTARTRAIMVEASLQNVAIVMFVAGALLSDLALAVPALIYAMVMNITALVHIGAAMTGTRGRSGFPRPLGGGQP